MPLSGRDRFWTSAFDWRPIAFWSVAFSVGRPRHTFYTASAECSRPPPCDARPVQIDPTAATRDSTKRPFGSRPVYVFQTIYFAEASQ